MDKTQVEIEALSNALRANIEATETTMLVKAALNSSAQLTGALMLRGVVTISHNDANRENHLLFLHETLLELERRLSPLLGIVIDERGSEE